ncbi:hypothetical protein PIB30_046774 [Stylosanthes scabra]|uniref:Uncharacterized protein n=1 Tax=Stylosanthes scabra TaxID=79078 RepID=A0ABU6XE99_9FABA|nr:hypothetical protein [Stylosanthes scabra]
MAGGKSSPSAKGKTKVYALPTRASPRLATLRAQSAATSYPETPVTPTVLAPVTAKRTARMFVKYYSMRLANMGGLSNVTQPSHTPIEIISDSETNSKPKDTIQGMSEEQQEDLEEDPAEDLMRN